MAAASDSTDTEIELKTSRANSDFLLRQLAGYKNIKLVKSGPTFYYTAGHEKLFTYAAGQCLAEDVATCQYIRGFHFFFSWPSKTGVGDSSSRRAMRIQCLKQLAMLGPHLSEEQKINK